MCFIHASVTEEMRERHYIFCSFSILLKIDMQREKKKLRERGGGDRKERPTPSHKQVKFPTLSILTNKWNTCFQRDKPGKGWLWCSFDEPEPETFGDPEPTLAMLFWETVSNSYM